MDGPGSKKCSLSGDLEASGLIKEASSESMSFFTMESQRRRQFSTAKVSRIKGSLARGGRPFLDSIFTTCHRKRSWVDITPKSF